MRLKNYGRNHKKRKEYIKQSGLLLVGVDVSNAKHDSCIGSLEGVRCRIGFRNARDGFKRFEDAIRKNMFRNKANMFSLLWSLQAFTCLPCRHRQAGMHFITGLKAVDTGFLSC